ncbi:hypothetical protein Tco_1198622 [Tanacetum coccineum]
MTMTVSEHFLHTQPSIGYRFVFVLRESSDFSEESVEKSWGKESANESGSEFIPRFDSSFVKFIQPCFCFPNSEEFVNVFMRIGFGSTIELISFNEDQVVTFDSKFVSSFRNSDCGTRSRSDNTVSSPHGFIIHWEKIFKSINKVTKVVDVENWRIDNSRVFRWIVSLIKWNSSVSSTTSSIQSVITPSLTPFEGGDFILKEIKACLTNDSIPPGIDDADFDPEGDLLLLEKLLNDDPPSPLPPKELHFEEIKMIKSSIDDPPELELKDLQSHLEYAFLEGTDKSPVIISKELKDEEKAALLKVLKSHKRAIAWKISDIKGIDPQFCTHKILMEDDFKPAVQHQTRVNSKIHEVIKKEVVKLLDAGLIYPSSDSPWVSLVHCMPKKGGMTVVENEDNELIPTRLVTGWRVCIDYRKLNDATRKDHFPLPFMDQMLERLAGNEYYCFLDGFSEYFQIPIDPQDQEKTTFTCPYGTFAY